MSNKKFINMDKLSKVHNGVYRDIVNYKQATENTNEQITFEQAFDMWLEWNNVFGHGDKIRTALKALRCCEETEESMYADFL